MTQKEIIEGNKLIAEFMGITWHGNNTVSGYPSVIPFDMGVTTIETTKFHSSWDWLMPVVEKIHAQTDIWVTIMYHSCKIHWMTQGIHEPILFEEMPTIDAVYNTILSFLTWYNQQPNKLN